MIHIRIACQIGPLVDIVAIESIVSAGHGVDGQSAGDSDDRRKLPVARELLQQWRSELRTRKDKRAAEIVPDVLIAVTAVLAKLERIGHGCVCDRERLGRYIDTV